jgi:hypothetical protein
MRYNPSMEKLYCLFTISSNSLYTTVPGCVPVNDYVLLENLRAHIAMVRPPSRSMTMEILETDHNCIPTNQERLRVQDLRLKLS